MKGHRITWFFAVVSGLLLSALLVGCSTKEPTPPVDEGMQAGAVALDCYKALYIQNRPEVFLRGRAIANSLDEAQRQQLLTLYKQHVLQTERLRGAVRHIDFVRAEPDTTLHVMQVFLKMTFADNMKEEIVVPMVQINGEWRME